MPLDDRLRESLRGAADDVRPDVEHHLALVRQRSHRRAMPAGRLLASVAAVAAIVILLRGASLDPVAMIGAMVAPSHPATVAASPEIAEMADLLAGTYHVRLDNTGSEGSAASMAGDWELTLGTDSSIALTPPDSFAAASALPLEGYVYALRDDRLFTNLFARHFEHACIGSGTYRWELIDAQLAIQPIDDMCLQRLALLTSQSWTRAGE